MGGGKGLECYGMVKLRETGFNGLWWKTEGLGGPRGIGKSGLKKGGINDYHRHV